MWCIHAGAYLIFGCFWLEFILCSKLFWKRFEKNRNENRKEKEKGEKPLEIGFRSLANPQPAQSPSRSPLAPLPRAPAHFFHGPTARLKALVWFWIIDETLSTNLYTKCV